MLVMLALQLYVTQLFNAYYEVTFLHMKKKTCVVNKFVSSFYQNDSFSSDLK
jgi:hypothetical protein